MTIQEPLMKFDDFLPKAQAHFTKIPLVPDSKGYGNVDSPDYQARLVASNTIHTAEEMLAIQYFMASRDLGNEKYLESARSHVERQYIEHGIAANPGAASGRRQGLEAEMQQMLDRDKGPKPSDWISRAAHSRGAGELLP